MQMLLVALSRRMCCSRVCRASRYAGLPSASIETPTRRRAADARAPARDGEEPGVRPAETQRDPEALGGADGDVGAHLAGRASRSVSASRSAGHDDQGAPLVGGLEDRRVVDESRRRRRVLRRRTPKTARRSGRPARVVGDGRPRCPAARRGSGRPRSSAGRRRRRRRTVRSPPRSARRTSVIASAAAVPSSSMEAFAMARPVRSADHGLEVEQRLEAALGDLRLVGRVGGVPGRVLQHVAPDHRRRDGAVVAQADHRRRARCSTRPAPAARRAPAPRSPRAAARCRCCRGCARRPSRRDRTGSTSASHGRPAPRGNRRRSPTACARSRRRPGRCGAR